MNFLKNNIPWIAPTLAIVVFSSIYLFKDGVPSFQAASVEQEAEIAGQENVATLNASVQAALDVKPVSVTETQTVAAIEAPLDIVGNLDVTRNAPLDLLELAPEVKPEVVEPAPQPAAFDSAAAADFFANAQANLAVDSSCKEDLAELASSAKIYFPAGGLAGTDAGLSAARLIGMVASGCPGFSVQVEGHSDPSGDPRINLVLSKKRAESIVNRLAASGIDTSNFVAVGFGDTQPSSVQGPEDSAYYDRRVEFSIVPIAQQASFVQPGTAWQTSEAECVGQLKAKADQARQYYAPSAITAPSGQLDAVFSLAADVANCDGAWLRIVGHHSDDAGTRENANTGRMRALAMLSNLTSAGFSQDRLLIAAPSYSVSIPGQPGLPNSRVDFQVVSD